MTNDDLVERIQKAFKSPKDVEAKEYQSMIEANAAKVAEHAEKSTFLLLSLMILFILIIEGVVKKVHLEIIEMKDLRFTLFIIPVILSYTHYDLVTALAKFDRLTIIHKNIIKQRHHPIYEQKLTEYFLATPNLYEYKYLSSNQIIHKIQLQIWTLQLISITIVIPIAFQFYAFWQIITHRHEIIDSFRIGYVALVITLLITTLLSLQSILTIVSLFWGANKR